MPSIIDLAKFAKRLRAIAEELKRLPADASSLEEREAISKEIKDIAARLRS